MKKSFLLGAAPILLGWLLQLEQQANQLPLAYQPTVLLYAKYATLRTQQRKLQTGTFIGLTIFLLMWRASILMLSYLQASDLNTKSLVTKSNISNLLKSTRNAQNQVHKRKQQALQSPVLKQRRERESRQKTWSLRHKQEQRQGRGNNHRLVGHRNVQRSSFLIPVFLQKPTLYTCNIFFTCGKI